LKCPIGNAYLLFDIPLFLVLPIPSVTLRKNRLQQLLNFALIISKNERMFFRYVSFIYNLLCMVDFVLIKMAKASKRNKFWSFVGDMKAPICVPRFFEFQESKNRINIGGSSTNVVG
jgi:hypothetical protein